MFKLILYFSFKLSIHHLLAIAFILKIPVLQLLVPLLLTHIALYIIYIYYIYTNIIGPAGVRCGELVPEDAVVWVHGHGLPLAASGHHNAVLAVHRLPGPRGHPHPLLHRPVRQPHQGQGGDQSLIGANAFSFGFRNL